MTGSGTHRGVLHLGKPRSSRRATREGKAQAIKNRAVDRADRLMSIHVVTTIKEEEG